MKSVNFLFKKPQTQPLFWVRGKFYANLFKIYLKNETSD